MRRQINETKFADTLGSCRSRLTGCDAALACGPSEGRRADIYSLATAQFGNHDFVRETFFVLPSLI
jgi:hypothetical protein